MAFAPGTTDDVEAQVSNSQGTSDGTEPPSPTRSGSSSKWRLLPWNRTSSYKTSVDEKPCSSDGPENDDIFIDDENDGEPIVRQLQACPEGYPQLGAFLDSDDNFMIYRRFGFLHSRLLLKKQHELRQLEQALDDLDIEDSLHAPRRLRTLEHYYDDQEGKERRDLDEKIEKKLLEYDALMQSAMAMTHCNRPSFGEYTSVKNFINNRQPLVHTEQEFIQHREDLIILRPGREHAWLDSSLEKLLKWMNCDLIERIFCSKETRKKTNGVEVYYSRNRIEACVVAIILLMILVLLIIPIYLLYRITIDSPDTPKGNAICIGILIVSTLAFSASISLFTRAKRHEILAASAAYCAILVVFISNINGGPNKLVRHL